MALNIIWSPEEITGDELSTHFLTVTASGGESSGFGPNQIVDGSPIAEEVVVQSPWEVEVVRPWGVREVPVSEVVDGYYFVPNDYTNTSEDKLSYLKQTIQINQLTTFSVQCTQIVSWGRELDYGRIKCTFLNVTNQVIGEIYLLSNYNPMVDGYTSFFMKGSVGWFTKEHSLNTTTPTGTRYLTLEFQSFSPEVIKRMGFTDIELFPLTLGYTYSLLKNGVEVTDKSYFNYLGDPSDTDFQWSVSDGVSTILSDLIPVNITGTPIPVGMKLILSKDSNPIERIIIPLSNDGGGVITYSREPEVTAIFNQYKLEMMDGIVHTSERSPFKRIKKDLLIISIPKSFGKVINDFVTNVLHFSDEPFTIELIDNNCYDVSLGLVFEKEPKVTNCVLVEESVFEMINYKEPGLCDVRLTYEFGG